VVVAGGGGDDVEPLAVGVSVDVLLDRPRFVVDRRVGAEFDRDEFAPPAVDLRFGTAWKGL
jgi:hypothetical protein